MVRFEGLKGPRRRFRFAFILALSVLSTLFVAPPPASAQSNVTGQWQTLPYQFPINPIHLLLLHTGNVVVVSGSGNDPADKDFRGGLWDLQTGTITTQSLLWDMFCNGMAALPDGRALIVSGTLQYDPFFGALNSSVYDPVTNQFVDVQPLAHGRWYPSATELADGSIMTFSGLDENGNTNQTVEIYKSGVGWSQPYTASWVPPLYPRMHLLPTGNVFYSGPTTQSAIFNTTTHTWQTNVATTNYTGTRTYGSSVLLPLLPANNYDPKILILGGGSPATTTTELIDMGASNPQWQWGPPMSEPRIEMDATILPNGKVFVSGGSYNDEDETTASLNADMYDPVSNTMSSAGAGSYARLYHSNTLLLPDATVAVTGGNPERGTFEPHIEIYSPPYLFNSNGSLATRPTISSVPASVGYGATFQVSTPNASSITSVVFMKPGAPTHAFDMDQRMVGVNFTVQNSSTLNVVAPPNSNIAPPGYYMIFLLNSAGVPSVAQFLRLSSTPSDSGPTGTITSPSANMGISPGQSVSFAGSATDSNGTVTNYSWVFPGGSPSTSTSATPGSVSFASAGQYVVSMTATDNNGVSDPSPPTRTITVANFSLSASPSSRTVTPGGVGSTATYPFTLSLLQGFTGSVSLSVSGLPAGANGYFNTPLFTAAGSTNLVVTASTTTPTGTYTLTVTGTNGVLNYTTHVTLIVSGTAQSTGYSYQGTITVPASQVVNSDQVNFPVLVSGTFPDLATTANGGKVMNANGYDIIFTSDSAGLNKLNFERASYSSTGQAEFWVQLPLLSHSTGATFYVQYGNPGISTDQSSGPGVWSANYIGVFHMTGSTNLNTNDSTNTGNGINSGATITPGQIGGAALFNGTSAYIDVPAYNTPVESFTISTWINLTATTNAFAGIAMSRDPNQPVGLSMAGGTNALSYIWNNNSQATWGWNSGITIPLNQWAYAVLTVSPTQATITSCTAGACSSASNVINHEGQTLSTDFFLGDDNESVRFLNGSLDELRFSTVARSSDWIATEYNNQSSPSTFYSITLGQQSGGNPTPWLSVQPASIGFVATSGGAAPASQSIAISSSNSVTLGSWTATVASGSPWLTLSTSATGAGSSSLTGSGAATIYAHAAITGLSPGSQTGSVTVTSSSAFPTSQSVSVTLSVNPGATWPNGYWYSGSITVPHAQVPNTDQANFPVLVSGTFPDFATTTNGGKVTNASGYDIVFASDAYGQNKLNFERQTYSPTGQVAFWVQVPLLSHTTDTTFYVFYGNPSVTTDQSTPNQAWDGNYLGVFHLPNGSTLTTNDSTGNKNATNNGAAPAQGEIGGGASFNGSSSYIDVPAYGTTVSAFTMSAWIYLNNTNNAYSAVAISRDPSQPVGMMFSGTSNVLSYIWNNNSSSSWGWNSGISVPLGQWTYAVLTVSGTQATITACAAGSCKSGVNAIAEQAQTLNTDFWMGQDSAGVRYLNGDLDEVRFSKIARSADWTTTEYNNQSNPSAFITAQMGLVSSGQPTPAALSVSPGMLNFTGTVGGSNPASQSITISSSNSTALGSWTATASSSSPWVTLSTSSTGTGSSTLSGTGSATIYIHVGISGLGSGTSNGSVTVTSASASPSSQTVTVSAVLSGGGGSGGTYANGYSYSGTITVAHGQVSNTVQTNFPVLFSGSFPGLATTANGGEVTNTNGYDIIFTSDSAGQNKLNFERESYSSSEQVAFWVQIPTLSPTTNTVFYVFYGNSSVTADPSTPTLVWDSNYLGVFHLPNGTTLTTNDSTNNKNGVNKGAAAIAGEIGGGANFNGTSSYIDVPAYGNAVSAFTISTWIYLNGTSNAYSAIAVSRDPSQPVGMMFSGATNVLSYVWNNNSSSTWGWGSGISVPLHQWTYAVLTVNGSQATITACTSGACNTGTNAIAHMSQTLNTDFDLGYDPAGVRFLNGDLDEVRISKAARSSDWIKTEYNNQSSPSTFFSAVMGQTSGPPPPPALAAAPTGLSFTGTTGGSNPSAQSVSISSSNVTTLGSWTATVASSSPWVTLSTTPTGTGSSTVTGTGAATIYVQVAIATLSLGTNNGSFTITSSTATPSSQTVSIAAAMSAPGTTYSNGYSYSGTITVAHGQVPNTDQTNFPVLVSGTFSALATIGNGGKVTNSNGYDIIFTSDAAGQNKLNFERGSYAVNGQVTFWVQVPTVSHTADTVFYVFYGNSSITADPSTPAQAWDTNYLGVFHLPNGTTLTTNDSTNNKNGVNEGATAIAGQIDGGANFNGTSSYIDVPAYGNTVSAFTISTWIYLNGTSNAYSGIVVSRDPSQPVGMMFSGTTNILSYLWNNNSSSTWGWGSGIAVPLHQWTYAVLTVSATQATMTACTAGTCNTATNAIAHVSQTLNTDFRFGYDSAAARFLNGALDEVRISKTARSADWITTEYNNQNSPSTFSTVSLGLTP
jgi:hypothetical protein